MTKAKPITEPQAPAVHVMSKAKFVTVASKMTQSIELQLCRQIIERVSGQHGTIETPINHKTGEVHVIRGTGYPAGQPPKGFPRRPELIEDDKGGYALTPKVPADFWFEWLKQNKDTEMVRNGLIKAQADLDDLAADAAEHASMDSGLGPLNPDGDRRTPKSANSQVIGVAKGDKAA